MDNTLVNKRNFWQGLDLGIVGCLSLILSFSLFSTRLLKVCFVIILSLWIIKHILIYKKTFYKQLIPKTFLNKAIGFFVIACVLSVLFSVDFKYSQRVFVERYLPYIIFFFMGVGITKANSKYSKWLIGVFLISGFVVGAGGVWDYITVVSPERLFSSFGNLDLSLHYYLTLLVPLSVVVFLFSKGKILKTIAFFTSLVAVPCLVWNFYRGAVVGLILSVLIVTWVRNKKVCIVVLGLLLICSVFLLSGRYIDRMLSTSDVSTWGDRIPLWKSAVSMWQDYPITGVGIRKYNDLMFEYEPKLNSIGRKLDHAHNTYFQVLAEEGILGLLAFLYIFYVFFKIAWKRRKTIKGLEEFGIIGGGITMIIAGLIFSWSHVLFILLPAHSSILWILFGIGVGEIEKFEVAVPEKKILKQRLRSLGYIN